MSIILPARYIFESAISSGGSGDISVCLDQHLDRRIAIKTIQNDQEKSRIFDEITALMSLRSRHVAQIYDIIIGANNNIGIVLEYIEGTSLEDIILSRPDATTCLKILWQIASGIADIHSTGLIHRDIKPANMKLDPENIIKIFDFGLSRERGTKSVTTGFKGTPGFAAPELFSHGMVPFEQAVDVYAFGVTALGLCGVELPQEMLRFPPTLNSENAFAASNISHLPAITVALHSCLNSNPSSRPSIHLIRDLISSYILKDQHQGLAVLKTSHSIINSQRRKANITLNSVRKFAINYDGFRFFISDIADNIFVNAQQSVNNDTLPGSSVIAIGDESLRSARVYVTFDISNPEVAL